MKHLQLAVVEQRPAARDFYEITMRWPAGVAAPLPGQFFTVRVGEGPSPLLRRPFAFSSFTPDNDTNEYGGGTAAFIYQRRGPATQLLTGIGAGEQLDVLAPLGTPFPLNAAVEHGGRPVLLGGGIGVGPMLFTAVRLRGAEPLLVVGARSKAFLPMEAIPEGIETVLCTDDGSYGVRGTTLQALEQRNTPQSRNSMWGPVLACGPNPMLEAAHRWASERSLPCYVSMEQTMGCAVGACMGCAVPVHGPERYARVCIEGPVLPSEQVDWEALSNA